MYYHFLGGITPIPLKVNGNGYLITSVDYFFQLGKGIDFNKHPSESKKAKYRRLYLKKQLLYLGSLYYLKFAAKALYRNRATKMTPPNALPNSAVV